MHAKPCVFEYGAPGSCSTSDATTVARYISSYVWDFLASRGLTGNLVMFGETWSNSSAGCNGQNPTVNDTAFTSQTVAGYLQSCLFGASDPLCTQYGISPNSNPASVVFRPWGNATATSSQCETPLKVGAPNGPFIY